MPLQKTTVAEWLQKAGYSTAVFGKWLLGHVKHFGPNDQGFLQSCVSNNTPDYHSLDARKGEGNVEFFCPVAKKDEPRFTNRKSKSSIKSSIHNKL